MNVADLFARLGLVPDEASFAKGDEQLAGIGRSLDGLKHGIEALGIAELLEKSIEWLHEGVDWLKETTEDSLEWATQLEHTAQSLGLTVEQVQELGYAAKLAGVDQEGLSVSLEHLARTMDEARHGSGEAVQALASLHIAATDPALKTFDGALAKIADRFATLPDGPTKTAAAVEIFGRSGAQLIPLLDKGSAGLGELREEARKLGVVLTESTVGAMDKAHEGTEKLSMVWDGIKRQLAGALAPTLSDLAERTLKWVEANRDLISSGVERVAHGLGEVLTWIAEKVGWIADHPDVLKRIFGDAKEIGKEVLGVVKDVMALMGPLLTALDAAASIVERLHRGNDQTKALGQYAHDIVSGVDQDAAADALNRRLAKSIGVPDEATTDTTLPPSVATQAALAGYTMTIPAGPTSGVAPAPSYSSTATNAPSYSSTATVNVTVHAAPGMDEDAIARKAADAARAAVDESNRNAFESIRGGLR